VSAIPKYQDRTRAKFLDCPETNPGPHRKNHPSSNSYGRPFGGLLQASAARKRTLSVAGKYESAADRAILLIATAPLYAQAQPDIAKLKADAQKVVSIISGDKAKTQTFCQMEILGNQIDEAILKQDTKKAAELAQKLTELEKNLGPEYLALVESLRNMT
jgi:hypothetical protein